MPFILSALINAAACKLQSPIKVSFFNIVTNIVFANFIEIS